MILRLDDFTIIERTPLDGSRVIVTALRRDEYALRRVRRQQKAAQPRKFTDSQEKEEGGMNR